MKGSEITFLMVNFRKKNYNLNGNHGTSFKNGFRIGMDTGVEITLMLLM